MPSILPRILLKAFFVMFFSMFDNTHDGQHGMILPIDQFLIDADQGLLGFKIFY